MLTPTRVRLPPDPIASLALPFPAALSASPDGAALVHVAIEAARDGTLQTVCRLRTESDDRVMWRSNKLTPTAEGIRIVWSPAGYSFAVGHFRKIILTHLDGTIRQHRFDRPIIDFRFTEDVELMVLAGAQIHRCRIGAGTGLDVVPTNQGVAAFAVESGALHLAAISEDSITVTRSGDSPCLLYDRPPGSPPQVMLRIHPTAGPILSCVELPQRGCARTRLVRCADGHILFDAEIGTGIAEPGIRWEILTDGAIALHAELDETVGVWRIGSDGRHQRLTDPSLEIDLASWSPDGAHLFVSGRDTERPGRRLSQCLGRDGTPRWSRDIGTTAITWHDSRRFTAAVECVSGGSSADWVLCDGDLDSLNATGHPATSGHCSASLPGGSEGAAMVLPRPTADLDFAIIYMMGPHRYFANGIERLFYHHALRANLDALCAGRGLLAGLNGAGALGVGRARRMADRSDYLATAVSDIEALVAVLRADGAARIAIVGASLGCLPVIHFLARHRLDAAVLVNPVYGTDLPVLAPWRDMLGPSANLATACDLIAPSIRTPLAIFHGQLDPISPSQHSSDFAMNVPADVTCDYVSVPDEGHIFQSDAGWRQMLQGMTGFLDRYLSAPETVTS